MNIYKLTNFLVEELSKTIFGKKEELKLILSTWITGGHLLLEDSPGTGKTVLSKALSKFVNVKFGRVQFTPDLLPSDIIGSSVIDNETKDIRFVPGPIFSTFFLADEINRATPRTQSALLECMAEKQITVENQTITLDPLFFVIATQNPIEQHGTFPLPEAQLDRFTMKISLGYPDIENEINIVKKKPYKNIENLKPIINAELFLNLRNVVSTVKVEDSIYEYTTEIVRSTRNNPHLSLGASPRATIALIDTAKGLAVMNGNNYVRPDDIYKLSPFVLTHRIMLNSEAKFAGKTPTGIINDILTKVKAPVCK